MLATASRGIILRARGLRQIIILYAILIAATIPALEQGSFIISHRLDLRCLELCDVQCVGLIRFIRIGRVLRSSVRHCSLDEPPTLQTADQHYTA